MGRLKKYILIILCSVFFLIAARDLAQELWGTCRVSLSLFNKSEAKRKEQLLGGIWPVAQKLAGLMPLDARVLIRMNDTVEMLYIAYELLPRKFYYYVENPNFECRDDDLGLDWQWLARKKISWVVLRMSDNRKTVMVLKIADGKILERLEFPG